MGVVRLQPWAADVAAELVSQYREQGFAVVRTLFDAAEVADIGAAIDAVRAEAVAHGRSFRHGNLAYRLVDGDVRMAQWPSWANATLDAVRLDTRYARLLAPLIGGDLKQIINQLHWKPRGSGTGGDFAWHQDSRFRRPAEAYRGLGDNYVQTGLAIDPHGPASGGLRVVPGSHRRGAMAMPTDGDVMANPMSDAALEAAGFDPASVVQLDLAPGDLALWSPYLVHASGANGADHRRRFYINGYVRADACDRGEWAFRRGQPVPLPPKPSLVHFEQLREQPGPHYF
ncbi:phytanoyl-CoA dioxygenase family protein [Sphingoaurantiacus capsulatus]|uniref:Phytanoyl-CoA dioxygenase family protein n=1 Tax=Sphingoaurantiacus capsulatus TaxID=1771310 RepID=A0ABV7X811_9SPHN